MCLLAVTTKRDLIPRDYLQNAYDHNSDGWGVMYAHKGRVITMKEKSGMNAFLSAWGALPTDKAIAVHFRFGTSGGRSDEMCHPFKVLDREQDGMDLFLMHNGVLPHGRWPGEKDKSDTLQFVEHVQSILRHAPKLIRSDAYKADLEDMIGGGNKMVFLEGNGRWHYLNHKAGDVEKKTGVWYSNTYSLKPVFSGHGKGKRASHSPHDWQDEYGMGAYGAPYYGTKGGNGVENVRNYNRQYTQAPDSKALAAGKAAQGDWYYEQETGLWWKPTPSGYMPMERGDDGRMNRVQGEPNSALPPPACLAVTIKNVAAFERGDMKEAAKGAHVHDGQSEVRKAHGVIVLPTAAETTAVQQTMLLDEKDVAPSPEVTGSNATFRQSADAIRVGANATALRTVADAVDAMGDTCPVTKRMCRAGCPITECLHGDAAAEIAMEADIIARAEAREATREPEAMDPDEYDRLLWDEKHLRTLTYDEMAEQVYDNVDRAILALGYSLGCPWAYEDDAEDYA